jgi:DNA-binding MarR family transcriptional regulator
VSRGLEANYISPKCTGRFHVVDYEGDEIGTSERRGSHRDTSCRIRFLMPSYQEPDKMTRATEPITSKVGYLVKRVQAALRATMDEELRPLGLSVSQYAILEALLEEGESESSNAAIARRCFITPQSANEMIAALTESELVVRRSSTRTPRIRYALTKRGRTQCTKARRRVLDIEERMLAGQTAADRKRIATLLTRCARALEGDT